MKYTVIAQDHPGDENYPADKVVSIFEDRFWRPETGAVHCTALTAEQAIVLAREYIARGHRPTGDCTREMLG